ncbi:Fe2OG dioxygenase domain-containing protein, partial [Haematococcus lacustris]
SHPCSGFLALRLHVAAESGKVQSVTFLADTLVPLPSVGLDVALVRSAVQEELSAWLGDCQFPGAMEDTVITVPVVFE